MLYTLTKVFGSNGQIGQCGIAGEEKCERCVVTIPSITIKPDTKSEHSPRHMLWELCVNGLCRCSSETHTATRRYDFDKTDSEPACMELCDLGQVLRDLIGLSKPSSKRSCMIHPTCTRRHGYERQCSAMWDRSASLDIS